MNIYLATKYSETSIGDMMYKFYLEIMSLGVAYGKINFNMPTRYNPDYPLEGWREILQKTDAYILFNNFDMTVRKPNQIGKMQFQPVIAQELEYIQILNANERKGNPIALHIFDVNAFLDAKNEPTDWGKSFYEVQIKLSCKSNDERMECFLKTSWNLLTMMYRQTTQIKGA